MTVYYQKRPEAAPPKPRQDAKVMPWITKAMLTGARAPVAKVKA